MHTVVTEYMKEVSIKPTTKWIKDPEAIWAI